MDDAILLSLKGESPLWRGIGDESTMLPGAATFALVEGAVISKDGSEFRRVPGTRLCGEPFFGQEWAVTNITGTDTWTVTLDAASQDNSETYLSPQFYVRFEGTGEPSLDGQIVVGTKTGPNTFSVVGWGSAPGGTTGTAFVGRIKHAHAMAHVGNRVVAVCETSVYAGATERTNVAAAVSSGPLDYTSPPEVGVRTAYPNEAGFIFWPTPTLTGMTLGERDYNDGLPCAAAQHVQVYRRIQIDTIHKRCVIAVPGSATLYQVNIGGGPPWQPVVVDVDADLPDHRWTKSLGIPRGVILNVNQTTSGGTLLDGFYGLAAGYWDPFSGEVGLPSRVTVAQATSGAGVSQFVVNTMRPRCVDADAAGLGVILYVSERQATSAEAETALLYPYTYAGPWKTTQDYHIWGTAVGVNGHIAISFTGAVNTERELLPGRLPILELPPPGGSVVRAVRGRIFVGGGYPDSWDLECWTHDDSAGRVYISVPNDALAAPSTNDGPAPHGIIPSSFGGYRIQRKALTVGLGRGTIVGVANSGSHLGYGGAFLRAYQVDFDYGQNWTTAPDAAELDTFTLQNVLTRIAFTEEGFPAISPAINRLELDARVSERLMGFARLGDALLAMTERETFLFSWNAAPRQSSQVVVSNQYGCVAPGSVVDGPFGVAWLSHEGPVLFDGAGIRWIGSKVRELWGTIQKDSKGQVHYCTAAIDLERALVVWGLREEAFAGEDDEDYSKESCDLLLVWNYAVDEFTLQRLSLRSHVQCMASLPHTNGSMRLSFMDAELPPSIRSWDQDAADRLAAPLELTVSAARAAGSDDVDFASGGTAVVLGDEAFIRSADGSACRWYGTVSSAGGAVHSVLDSTDGATWKAGDVFVTGVVHQRWVTNRLRFGDLAQQNVLTGVVIRADLDCDHAYAIVKVRDEDGGESFLTPRWGQRMTEGVTRLRRGQCRGNDIVLDVTIVSDGQITVKDIGIEVQGGDR